MAARILISVMMIVGSIAVVASDIHKQEAIEAVRATELAFNDMAAAEGVKAAFLYFADEQAVLNRNNKIIRGKQAISDYFDQSTLTNVRLSWAPDFVDVSDDFSLAYTYGKFQFQAVNAEGENVTAEGIFHTVWKRQKDGQWRYVYD